MLRGLERGVVREHPGKAATDVEPATVLEGPEGPGQRVFLVPVGGVICP